MAEAAEPLFKVHYLGTSSGLPTRSRDLSCLVVEVGGRLILLDACEGAQLSILRRGFNISAIDAVCVTHRHGDHCFGLPGLYGTLWLMSRPLPVLVGDDAVLRFLASTQEITTGQTGAQPTIELRDHRRTTEVLTLRPRVDVSVKVSARLLEHRVPAHGFRVEVTRHHRARVDVARLKAAGIPPGPIYGQLQRGEDATTADGQHLKAAAFQISGWDEHASFVYLTDTCYCPASVELARGADVVSHEATFLPGQEERALDLGHATAGQAIDVMEESGAKRLILTHFSARHREADYEKVVAERGVEGRVSLAYDGMVVDVMGIRAP